MIRPAGEAMGPPEGWPPGAGAAAQGAAEAGRVWREMASSAGEERRVWVEAQGGAGATGGEELERRGRGVGNRATGQEARHRRREARRRVEGAVGEEVGKGGVSRGGERDAPGGPWPAGQTGLRCGRDRCMKRKCVMRQLVSSQFD